MASTVVQLAQQAGHVNLVDCSGVRVIQFVLLHFDKVLSSLAVVQNVAEVGHLLVAVVVLNGLLVKLIAHSLLVLDDVSHWSDEYD